jgi:hypothetical protein
VKWLYLTYIIYWAAVALTTALAAAGYYIVEPETLANTINETASSPYEQRLLQSALDLLVVAAASYPALFYAAAAYGAVTAALAEVFDIYRTILYVAVAHVVLLFFAQVAQWHPVVQYLTKRRIDWKRYVLWLVASLSLLGILSL